MGTIKNLRDRVQRLDLQKELPVLVERTSDTVVELNQEQLYLSGIDADGDKLREYRSDVYAEYKHSLNPNPGAGTPDLNLTGAFYNGFFVAVGKDTFEVSSRDDKTNDLTNKYSTRIFGLTEDSKERYSLGVFFSAVKSYITQVTGLEFK